MGLNMHPYMRKDFWAKDRAWNNGWYTEKSRKQLNKDFDKIVREKMKPELK